MYPGDDELHLVARTPGGPARYLPGGSPFLRPETKKPAGSPPVLSQTFPHLPGHGFREAGITFRPKNLSPYTTSAGASS